MVILFEKGTKKELTEKNKKKKIQNAYRMRLDLFIKTKYPFNGLSLATTYHWYIRGHTFTRWTNLVNHFKCIYILWKTIKMKLRFFLFLASFVGVAVVGFPFCFVFIDLTEGKKTYRIAHARQIRRILTSPKCYGNNKKFIESQALCIFVGLFSRPANKIKGNLNSVTVNWICWYMNGIFI